MEVVHVSQGVEVIAIGIQQRDVHRNLDLEHVENWSCHHYLQIHVKGLLPNHRISQHDQKERREFAVHHEKKILVHFCTLGESADSLGVLSRESDGGRNRPELSRDRTILTRGAELTGNVHRI